MSRLVHWSALLGVILVSVFVVLFLGGLASAALEIRAEKKAGKVPTRPAWENRDKRRAVGGFGEQIRLSWQAARKRGHGIRSCWCGRGPIQVFPADDGTDLGEGWGCCAWEAGDLVAVQRHDAAGGYRRTPTENAAREGWAA